MRCDNMRSRGQSLYYSLDNEVIAMASAREVGKEVELDLTKI